MNNSSFVTIVHGFDQLAKPATPAQLVDVLVFTDDVK